MLANARLTEAESVSNGQMRDLLKRSNRQVLLTENMDQIHVILSSIKI